MEKKTIITKEILVKETAAELSLTQAQVSECLNALIYRVNNHLAAGEKVRIYGLGTFDTAQTPASEHFVPNYGPVKTPAKQRVRFHPSTLLKALINPAHKD